MIDESEFDDDAKDVFHISESVRFVYDDDTGTIDVYTDDQFRTDMSRLAAAEFASTLAGWITRMR